MNLSGNTILITGGSSGIGLAFAREFAALGNTIIICGRREDKLAEVKGEIEGIITKKCDVASANERTELYNWILAEYPETNILINNAGVQMAADLTTPVDLERIYAEVDTNFIAPLHLSSLFAAHLSGVLNGAIINISSGLAFVPIAFMPVYCATKAAIHSLTLSLRHQLRNTSVKVFEVLPPSVDTWLGHDYRADKSQSHGGIPVSEFISEAMEGLKNDVLETAVGMANNLRTSREEMFGPMNSRFA